MTMETWSNRSPASELTLEGLEKALEEFLEAERARKAREALDPKRQRARAAAAAKAFEWGFKGLGVETAHLTVAPDVLDRFRRLAQVSGDALDGSILLHGLPVYGVAAMPAGWWMRWEDGSPCEVGRLTEGSDDGG